LPVSLIELGKLLQVLNENPTLKVEISGYTDNTGKPEDNIKLSANRAKAVVDYLMGKNISANRLTYKGYGAAKPIADNTTEKGRAKNRRTEFMIIGLYSFEASWKHFVELRRQFILSDSRVASFKWGLRFGNTKINITSKLNCFCCYLHP